MREAQALTEMSGNQAIKFRVWSHAGTMYRSMGRPADAFAANDVARNPHLTSRGPEGDRRPAGRRKTGTARRIHDALLATRDEPYATLMVTPAVGGKVHALYKAWEIRGHRAEPAVTGLAGPHRDGPRHPLTSGAGCAGVAPRSPDTKYVWRGNDLRGRGKRAG